MAAAISRGETRRMSETWTSLLAALVGAIVGGAASLAGTMLVNKQQMATNARMRLYDQLLPDLSRAIADWASARTPFRPIAKEYPLPAVRGVIELLTAVSRASAIAGRHERRFVNDLRELWREYEADLWAEQREDAEIARTLPKSVNADPDQPGLRLPPSSVDVLLLNMQRVVAEFSNYLAARLG
jgi:hypothetical protein